MVMNDLTKCPICDSQGFFVHNPEAFGGYYECPECHGKGWLTPEEVEEHKAKWLKPMK